MRSIVVLIAALFQVAAGQQIPPIEYYRLVPGFMAESFSSDGMARGTGFAAANPWGAYTAYLLATNAKGQRTWRIENYLPNPTAGTAQGSTCYLFEGNTRALLVDTANNTVDEPGKNDLTTVVRHLLGHRNDGSPKPDPVDFVVANTHSHGDHTGKNSLMSDRAVYYPDLDWPRNSAPPNYIPIKEGGGATTHGNGQALGELDLGARTIAAVDIHEHTPGSTGYLDRENKMIATGDAIGSGYVWAHFGSMTQYAAAVHHLQDVLRPFDRVDVLPAHFYQVNQGGRAAPPLNGRPLDKGYVDDQVRVVEGILNGSIVGEPYRSVGRNAAIATVDSGQVVYTLGNLYPGGLYESTGDRSKYHAVAIPRLPGSGLGQTAWQAAPVSDPRYAAIEQIKSGFYLIRDYGNETIYLIVGSTRALVVGTGSGTPGLAAFVKNLTGALPLAVVVTSGDAGQIGGLAQFTGNALYLPNGVAAPSGASNVTRAGTGTTIDLGLDRTGRPLLIEVHSLSGHSADGLTLLDVNDRVLLSGDALGTQGNDAGLMLHDTLEAFARALTTWRAATDGKYDLVYTAHNYQWLTSPAYVDEVQSAVKKGLADGEAALIESTRMPGVKMLRSAGAPDVVASIVVAKDGK